MSGADDRPIVLAGFMGSGKTTVGRRVARILGRQFADADGVLVEKSGRSIPQIFDEDGEAAFRAAEKAVVAELVEAIPPLVIALGGGALEDDEIRALLVERAWLVHLDRPFDDVLSSLESLRRGRPMLRDRTDAEIRALYDRRRATYLSCPIQVRAGVGVNAVARAVVEALSRAGLAPTPAAS